MTVRQTIAPEEAFEAYQNVRHRLPSTAAGPTWIPAEFAEIAGHFDLVLFDAYGVLNVGDAAIPGAAARVSELRRAGKRVGVVSNSAGYAKGYMMDRWRRLGFEFTPEEVVTSRDATLAALARERRRTWGVMLGAEASGDGIEALDLIHLGEDPSGYARAEGFLLIGSDGWTEDRQGLLEAALRQRPRPVVVANPDLVAPREAGLSYEPGWFAHRLSDATGVVPRFMGKPFPEIFHLALARCAPSIDPARVLMVGDTLHTDILGGRRAGFATALVTAHGALSGIDPGAAIAAAGISPTYVVDQI